jgi:hypothetical protein
MSYKPETPFDSIGSAHEYVALLLETVQEAQKDVEAEVASADAMGALRRKEALQLVSYNLGRLAGHMTSSRRILNDLRTLRRLLIGERSSGHEAAEPAEPAVLVRAAGKK